MPHRLDSDSTVYFYENEFYPLSNFSAFRLGMWGNDFDTSEHAYHWRRFNSCAPLTAERVRRARSAHEAFRLAQANKGLQRKDWDDIKIEIMRQIIRAKAEQHPYVRKKLLETGDRRLVEDSWRDSFWGWGPDHKGDNMLGNLWMELRDKIRAELGFPA